MINEGTLAQIDSLPSPRILVVEDEWPIARELQDRLQGMGFDVTAICASAEEAIGLCERDRPGLVLMDIFLNTEMTGIEAARVIGRRFDIPIVFLSAFSHSSLIQDALTAAPYGYLLKPFNIREVKLQVMVAAHRHSLDLRTRGRHQLLQAIVASTSGAVIASDCEGNVTYLNPEAERLTGYAAREVLGRPIGEVFRLTRQDLPEDPAQRPSDRHHILTRDRRRLAITLTHQTLRSPSGETLGDVFTFRERSES